MKKTLIAYILTAALLFSACAATGTDPAPGSETQSAPVSAQPETTADEESAGADESGAGTVAAPECFTLEEISAEFDIHTPEQSAYLGSAYDRIGEFADGRHEYSKPRSITLSWDFFAEAEEYGVLLDTDPNFTAPAVKTVPGSEKSAEFGNLLIGAEYFWKVRALLANGETYESGTSRFSTAGVAPRNLDIDGVPNVRDVGGWQIDATHRVKQGEIYRGGAFDDDLYGTHITEKGISQARDELGVKCDIELRWISAKEISSRGSSLLGSDVLYYEFEFNYSDEKLLLGNTRSIARCFRIFADENKHPVYYHCRIGTDRTGLLTYLLLGFLGVEKETLLRDYLFSNFGSVGGLRQTANIQKAYIDIIDSYEGGTLQEKITYFLKTECKLSDATLEKIKAIMTEEY